MIWIASRAMLVLFAIAQAPVLPIAVEDKASPWSRPDGTGFANDVVRAAFRAAGVDVQLQVVPYARCKELVLSGKGAACFSMSPEPALAKVVHFPHQPIFVCQATLVQRTNRPLPGRRLRELPRGTLIGIVRGYEYPVEVGRVRDAGVVRFEESASEEILLRKLEAGRLQGAIINVNDSKPLAYVMDAAGVAGGVEPVERVGALSSFIGFNAHHPRGSWALKKFETGMTTISRNGELRRITRAWADSSRRGSATMHPTLRPPAL